MEQQGLVAWFRNKFPETLILAIPNGEYRAMTTAKKLRAEGVVPGVPDLYVPAFKMWIEMKRKEGGTVSDEQKRIHAYLKGIGDIVIVGYGAEDASRKILDARNQYINNPLNHTIIHANLHFRC
jgi:hypothetical protein